MLKINKKAYFTTVSSDVNFGIRVKSSRILPRNSYLFSFSSSSSTSMQLGLKIKNKLCYFKKIICKMLKSISDISFPNYFRAPLSVANLHNRIFPFFNVLNV